MNRLIKIAFYNTIKNKRRTLSAVVLISFCTILVVFISAFFHNMKNEWRDLSITREYGDIQIMPKGAQREAYIESPLELSIEECDKIMKKLDEYDFIIAYTPRIDIMGLVSTGEGIKKWTFLGRGIDPDSVEVATTMVKDFVVKGRLPKSDEVDAGLIGTGLAKRLNVSIGDTVFLVTNDKHGSINSVDVKVIGLLDWEGYDIINSRLVYMHMENAKKLTRFDDHEYTSLVIRTDQYDQAIEHKLLIEREINDDRLEFFSWQQLAIVLEQLIDFYGVIFLIIDSALLLLVLVGIMNTISMSVFERKREIGTLMALGFSRLQIRAVFMFESLFVGALSGLIGIILGIGIVLLIEAGGGITTPPPPDTDNEFTFHLMLNYVGLVQIFFSMILVSFLAFIIPTNKAVKQKPADVLRAV